MNRRRKRKKRMPGEIYDLNPITHITAGAIGEPGERTFYLQARQGSQLVTLVCEKQQVAALALGVEQLLEQLAQKDPEQVGPPDQVLDIDMTLDEPLDPVFRVGQMGLGYDEDRNLLVLVAQELLPEGEDPATASSARFWGTAVQMRTLARHAAQVVAAGRPLCPLCGEPMDPQNPEAHFCPRRNGHSKPILE
jgi:uncharacterized repeat protein (TIGR03847 family)